MQKPIVKTTSRGLAGALALTAAALAGGCEEPTPPLVPTTLTVSPGTVDLEDVIESIQLTATVADQNGATMPEVTVHWLSSDETVVTVNSRGLVRAKEEGTAAVWGFVEDLVDSVSISVSLGPRGVLMRIYHALGGPDWANDTNWGTTQPLDSWTGVGTDAAGNVTRLSLAGNEVAGRIAPEIGLLEHLEELNLSDNNGLRGTLPPEIGNLRRLVTMNFGSSGLGGSIPPEIGNLGSLTHFLNPSPMFSPGTFRGQIPPEFGNLANLEVVDFTGNELSGSLPPELGNLGSLRIFNIQGNALRGTVPAEFGNLQSLSTLRINGNPMNGVLPGELTNLSLRRFHWFATHLCAPADAAFKEWLAGISDHNGGEDCEGG